MKRKTIFAAVAAGVTGLVMAAFTLSPLVAADGQGQIGGGPIYQIANLTQKTGYANPASANACDELEYSVKLHNSGYSSVTNVVVSATLPSTSGTSNTSNLTATYQGGVVPSTSASATVNLSSAQTVSYESGSTELFDGNGNVIKNLSDGVIGSGINVGTLPGSTTEFVNFKAKVSCPTPPPAPVYTCNDLELTAESNRTVKISTFTTSATNGAVFNDAVVTWGDNSNALTSANPVGQTHQYAADGTYVVSATAHFTVNGQDVTATGPQCQKQVTFSSTTPPQVTPPPATPPATPAAPTALVNTGPGSVIGLFGAATAAGTFLYRRMLSRRLSRQ